VLYWTGRYIKWTRLPVRFGKIYKKKKEEIIFWVFSVFKSSRECEKWILHTILHRFSDPIFFSTFFFIEKKYFCKIKKIFFGKSKKCKFSKSKISKLKIFVDWNFENFENSIFLDFQKSVFFYFPKIFFFRWKKKLRKKLDH